MAGQVSGDLSAAHRQVWTAACGGEVADFSSPDDGPEPAHCGYEEVWTNRTIDGAWLAGFLCSPETPIHRLGLHMVGARILGGVDLEGADIGCRVRLVGCQLGAHPVRLADAKLRTFDLAGTHCGGVIADNAEFRGSLRLCDGFQAAGAVRVPFATVDGSIDGTEARLVNQAGSAFVATGVRVSGSVWLRHRFEAIGEVRMIAADIGGDLDCSAGRFTNPAGLALVAEAARIGGRVFLSHGFVAQGDVDLNTPPSIRATPDQ